MTDNPNNPHNPYSNMPAHLRDLIEETAGKLKQPGVGQTQLQQQTGIRQTQMNSLENLPRSYIAERPALARIMATAPDLISRAQTRITTMNQARLERVGEQFAGRVTAPYADPAVHVAAKEMMYSSEVNALTSGFADVPYQELERQKRVSYERIKGYSKSAHGAARQTFTGRTISDPTHMGRLDMLAQIKESDVGLQQEIKNIAAIGRVQNQQRALGLDPKSKEQAKWGFVAEAQQQRLTSQMQQTGSVTVDGKTLQLGSQVLEEFNNKLKELTDSIKRAKESTDENVKAEEALKQEKLTSDLGTLEIAKKVGGSGGRAAAIAGLARVGQVIGEGINTIGVDYRIANRQNIAGMAGLENEKYAMYKAARGGDVASQMAMMQWDSAQKFGQQIKTTSKIGEAVNGVSGATLKYIGAGALGIAAGASALTGIGIPIAGALATGAAGLYASAALEAGSTAVSLAQDTKSTPNYIKGVTSHMEAVKAINAVPAEQMQGLRDFYVGGGMAAQNMGRGGEAFLNQVTGKGPGSLLTKMAGANISPEQMIQMAQLGTSTLGSQFSTDQVFSNRQLEKANMGSMALNMQRMGTLTAAGANNPQAGLDTVIAAALTKSLTDAPTLNKMVENTAALVSQTQAAAAGIDTTGVVSAALAAQVDPSAGNTIFAAQRALTAQQIARTAGTNVSTTFSGMMNTSRISQVTGLSGIDAITAGETDVSEWKALQTDPNALKKIRSMGMTVEAGKEAELIKKMIDLKQRQVAEGAGAANALGGLSESAFQKLKTGTLTETDPEYDQTAKIARRAGYKTVEEYQRAVRSGDTNAVPGADLQKLKEAGAGKKTLEADFLRTDQFKQLSDAAGFAADSLNAVGDALTIFTEMQTKVAAKGKGTESEFSESAANAAKSFVSSTNKFDETVTRLESTVNVWAKQAGLTVKESEPKNTKVGTTNRAPEPN